MKILKIVILVFFILSCKNKETDKLTFEVKSINFFNDYKSLAINSYGVYFEIKLVNQSSTKKCKTLKDTSTVNRNHYISFLFLESNQIKYKLLDLRPLRKEDDCIYPNDSLTLRLLLLNDFLRTDLKGLKKESQKLLNYKSKIKFNEIDIFIDTNKVNYYLNSERIKFKDIDKLEEQVMELGNSKALLKQVVPYKGNANK